MLKLTWNRRLRYFDGILAICYTCNFKQMLKLTEDRRYLNFNGIVAIFIQNYCMLEALSIKPFKIYLKEYQQDGW